MSDVEELSQEAIDEFVVAAHGDFPKVQRMLNRDPRLLNENATWIETPLGAAAHTASREIAEYLLAAGAPLDICAAAMLGREEDVTAFLDAEPDLVHVTGAHFIPLLFHAAIGGNLRIVSLLVERGADVNAGEGMNSALHGAAGFGYVEIARYLLDQGADFSALDHEGRTPLDVAEATENDDIAAMLRDYTGMDE